MAYKLEERLRLSRLIIDSTHEPLSVPLGLRFQSATTDQLVKDWSLFRKTVHTGAAPNRVHLYLHVPFCARKCSYCMLASQQPSSRRQIRQYVSTLCDEIEGIPKLVGDIPVTAVHLGGGSPSQLTAEELRRVLEAVHTFAELDNSYYFAAELHPRSTTREKLEILKEFGVDRVSFGVQTLSQQVLTSINRTGQTGNTVRHVIDWSRELGIPAINLDLLAGLPGETPRSFARTVKACVELNPDSIAINRFLLESSPLESCGLGRLDSDCRLVDKQMLIADRVIRSARPTCIPEQPLQTPGYGTAYSFDHTRAVRGLLEEDETSIIATLALGHGGVSHIHGQCFAINAGTVSDALNAHHRGEQKTYLRAPISRRFEQAFFVAEAASKGTLRGESFRTLFGEELLDVFGQELRFLETSRLVDKHHGQWRKPASRTFQPIHLVTFLLNTNAELRHILHRLEARRESVISAASSYYDEAAIPLSQLELDVSPGAAANPSAPLILHDDTERSPAKILRQAPLDFSAQTVVLWTSLQKISTLDEAQELRQAGVDELVIETASWRGSIPDNIINLLSLLKKSNYKQIQMCLQLPPSGELHQLPQQLQRLAELSVAKLFLVTSRELPLAAAEALLQATRHLGIGIETLHQDARWHLRQYEMIEADMPMSYVWCRIGLLANRQRHHFAFSST